MAGTGDTALVSGALDGAVGTGIRGSRRSHSCPRVEFSTARSAGAFIRRHWSTALRFTVDISITRSTPLTFARGDRASTTPRAAHTRTASTPGVALRVELSTQDRQSLEACMAAAECTLVEAAFTV